MLSCDYRSSAHRLAVDFFAPVLRLANTYDRAVAYFSSSVFFTAPDEFGIFFDNGGTMRLICSPFLEKTDVEALTEGVFDRPRVLKDRRKPSELLRAGASRALVGALIARGLLRIRIATGPLASSERLFHEKIGLFRDANTNVLAFSGSANESRSAWLDNFERIDVFLNWGSDSERLKVKRVDLQFSDLWKNQTPNLLVRELAEAVKAGILKARADGPNGSIAIDPIARSDWEAEALIPAPDIHLFPHQTDAIYAWGNAAGRGILEMATGSGKTITALTIASKLYDGIGPGLAILIIAPYIHLVDQWCQVASRFSLTPVRCAEATSSWREELQAAVYSLNAGTRKLLSVATTPNTLSSPTFREIIGRIRKPLIVIGDEVHNYGTAAVAAALPNFAQYRVGLSATPDRWMDEDGTDRIREYFGSTVFKYGLEQAIRDEILTPYRYNPILVELHDDELDEYFTLTRLLSRYIHGEKDGPVNDAAKKLLIRRARLLASAAGKLPKLVELLTQRRSETHILVYCGDGQVEGPEPESSARQVDEAVRVIGRDLRMTCAKYTAETTAERRQEVLKLFSNGDLQVLVAIRCLDEGVDIPAAKTAYILASSTNPRQFVQRRGRLLRRFPGKKRADIYDFFVAPPLSDIKTESVEYPVVRRLFGNQIRRAREFASLADNAPLARAALRNVTVQLNLLSEWSDE